MNQSTNRNSLYIKLPRWLSGQEFACQCRRGRRLGFDPWVRKIPWRRKWQPSPVFWPGKSHGQRSLVDYSPWGRKESDMTERLHFHFLCLQFLHSWALWISPRLKTCDWCPYMYSCIDICKNTHTQTFIVTCTDRAWGKKIHLK